MVRGWSSWWRRGGARRSRSQGTSGDSAKGLGDRFAAIISGVGMPPRQQNFHLLLITVPSLSPAIAITDDEGEKRGQDPQGTSHRVLYLARY